MAAHGAIITLRALDTGSPINITSAIEEVRHPKSELPLADALWASQNLRAALVRDGMKQDILHTHGLWLMPNVYPAWAVQRRGACAKLVHSIRGMLGREALQFSALKKRAFWALLQGHALRAAHCVHATAESEYEEIRGFGLRNPVAVIPNGIDFPPRPSCARQSHQTRTVLSLGRVHPKKGLERLVRAWAEIEPDHPEWRLRIVGPPERKHDLELRALATTLGVCRVAIEAPLYAKDKLTAMQDADLFVLPTLNENFGIVVAESLVAETPVICTKGAPWAGLESERCGWWIDHGEELLAAALRAAMALPRDELQTMGARGRAWMARDFDWSSIALQMMAVYRWLHEGGDPPGCVRLA